MHTLPCSSSRCEFGRRAAVCAAILTLIATMFPNAPLHAAETYEEAQTRINFTTALLYVGEFEKEVARAEGKPLGETHNKRQAMERVAELMKLHPDDPRVAEMRERVRVAIMGGKGQTIEITPEMIRYLTDESAALEVTLRESVAQWHDTLGREYFDSERSIPDFPAPDPEKSDPDRMTGARVLLKDFAFDRDVFQHGGEQWVALGNASKGYYFVKTSSRRFIQCREAVKRARSEALGALPAGFDAGWEVLGEITGVNLLVPGGGENNALSAHVGWEVEPIAVNLPGVLCALPGTGGEVTGSYAGEAEVKKLIQRRFTVEAVPPDTQPEELMRLHLLAIKEKNWTLFLDTIHPSMRQTEIALSFLEGSYTSTLRRLHGVFVHAEPFEVSPVITVEGEAATGAENLEALFLTDKDQEASKARDIRTRQRVTVKSRRFDEKGRQVEGAHRMTLERSTDVEANRWFITAGLGF